MDILLSQTGVLAVDIRLTTTQELSYNMKHAS